ncbi:MAG TPA: hypothetical protein VFN54_05525 [Acidimicrobiales bacterium]|nr:hypothetical protein [Acidimicrobiales bacterium]
MKLDLMKSRRVVVRAAIGALLPLTLLATAGSASSGPAVTTLVAPAIPGVAALPFTGITAPPATASPTMGNLTLTPYSGVEGTPFSIAGASLPANTPVTLTWSTASVSWNVDAEPNTVNYLGRAQTNFNVVLATVTTDASGAFSYKTTVPVDFGGTHDIYAVVNGVNVLHGGFEVFRTLSVTPKSGPIGTPIHITYTGIGASLYTGGGSVLWDNHFTGEVMANWTRGTASVTIRAAGPVGRHVIQVGDGIGVLYMNIIQSPVPYANGGSAIFTTTKGHVNLAPSIVWPTQVTPTLNQVTTLSNAGLDPASKAVATLSTTSGPVLSKTNVSVTGLTGTGTDQLVWSTVVGSRVNCPTSSCWAFQSVPLGSAAVVNGALSASVTIPDGLGGWHVIQVVNGSSIEAQVPFYVKESIVPFYDKAGKLLSMGIATSTKSTSAAALAAGQSGVGTYKFKEGQELTISLRGVGWTQLDNTLAVDYDNSHIGYGCGFNSQGYTVIHLFATGGVGTHIIDLYPQLYTNQPSFPNTPYGMLPVLSYARDFPGLALGYQVPSFHFAITIVK